MKIKILKDNDTATDPRTVISFKKDEIVELKQDLANNLIRYGLAIELIEEKVLPKFENKAIFSAPENKEVEISTIVEEDSENKKEIKINNKKKGKK